MAFVVNIVLLPLVLVFAVVQYAWMKAEDLLQHVARRKLSAHL